MLYAIIATDVERSLDKRLPVRDAHIARLKELLVEGRLILAGPHPSIDSPEAGESGFTGSLVVAEFDCLEQAQAWAQEDPYVASGAYSQVQVKPFKKVLP
ncbi:MAG: YciI family protein [Candidatus Eutrophobiaceae bacterium]